MIDLKLNKGILLVGVPSNATDFDMPEQDNGNILQYKDPRWRTETLPSGNWNTPIKANEVTEAIAKQLLAGQEEYGYYPEYTRVDILADTALQSFKSLLTHHSLSPDKTILIIEK